jgi:hypothetical protein
VAITGTLDTMPLADLVQFVGLSRKTGVLRVESPLGRKNLVFDQGQAIYCSSDNPKEYLGQHLLARTKLTEADLERAFRLQKQTGEKLGTILVTGNFLTQAELDTVLRHKVEDAMFELFTWRAGTFVFDEGHIAAEDIPVRIDVGWQDLVMEGARRSDEMSRIRAAIPGPHVRLHARRERFPEGFPRSGGDRKLVALIDEGASVAEILAQFHASDFQILARLRTLIADGLVEVDAESASLPAPTPGADAIRRASQLEKADRAIDALEVLRAAAKDHPGNAEVAAALAGCEDQVREKLRYVFADQRAVPRLRVALETLATAPLSAHEAFVATRINGTWPVASIVQICPFDELDVLCTLDGLMRQGLVEIAVPVRI